MRLFAPSPLVGEGFRRWRRREQSDRDAYAGRERGMPLGIGRSPSRSRLRRRAGLKLPWRCTPLPPSLGSASPRQEKEPSPTRGYGIHGSDSLIGRGVIQGPGQDWSGALMAFGDIRVAERADWLIERVAALGTVVLRRIGETRAGEMAVHRFLSSPHVSTENIVTTLSGARRRSRADVGSWWCRTPARSILPVATRSGGFRAGRERQDGGLLHPSGDCHRCRDRGGDRAG